MLCILKAMKAADRLWIASPKISGNARWIKIRQSAPRSWEHKGAVAVLLPSSRKTITVGFWASLL